MQNKRRTYIRTISDNIADHKYKQSNKRRDRNTDQETYIYTKNEVNENIFGHWNTQRQKERERNTDTVTDIHTQY